MKNNKEIAINIDKVSKRYFLRDSKEKKPFFALKEINLKIFKGEKVAVLGDNGAGKTTLLKLMTGIAEPTQGKIGRFGKVVSLIDITAGFHEEFSGRENIYLNGILLGMNIAKIKKLEQKIIDFSGIDKFIDQALYTYSSGMVLRLGFSIAINADPDILILDEGIIVGDQDFQKKAYDKVEEIFARGKTIVVCSHMLPLLSRLCDRFIWINDGKMVKDGGKEVLMEYKKSRNSLQLEKIPSNEHAVLFFDFLKTLPIGERFIAKASSGSMEPLILKGDEVLVEIASFSKLKKGDIIAFWSDELKNVVVHRFYKMEKGKIVTKGDNNLFADAGHVDTKNFLGILVEND
jgi:ABC-type polysaccharide/polyol phosphate transport system ATPase subunit